MRANTYLLTGAAKEIAEKAADNYQKALIGHTAADWSAHTQLKLYATLYKDTANHFLPDSQSLRMTLTGLGPSGTGDGNFVCPVIFSGETVNYGEPPQIIQHPSSLTVYVGQTASFSVIALSNTPVTYQWKKNGTNLPGKTDASLVITNAQSSDAGSYSVVVANEFGTVRSNSATLTVLTSTPPSGGGGGGGGGCLLPDTPITMATGQQKPIQNILVGDTVASFEIGGLPNEFEDAWKTWKSPELVLKAVKATVVAVDINRYVGYYNILGLKVTYEHPVLIRRDMVWQFVRAREVKESDYIWKNGLAVSLKNSITYVEESIETYNINVEPSDVFVAANSIVHNSYLKE
jgi:hypothetical protein